MTTIAVTGAAGSIGRRVVDLLLSDPTVTAVKGLDRVETFATNGPTSGGLDYHCVDVADPQTAQILAGCDSVVHLADDPSRRTDAFVATNTLRRLLASVDEAGCRHVVLLSSALVYGAYQDNPIPLTELHRPRPIAALDYATVKAGLEEVATEWATASGGALAVLRPTTTLSESGVSFIAGALRAATSVRPDQVDPPVQFLHHDDLASAVTLVATRQLSSVFNVAPDGWIGPDVFNELRAEAEIRLPEPIHDRAVAWSRAISRAGERGLEAYVAHPWVVANDRLRAAGWEPEFTNEEAYVLGNPAPFWRTFSARRRQELALAAVGSAGLGAVVGLGLLARRFLRP